jgi:hypothetical protein
MYRQIIHNRRSLRVHFRPKQVSAAENCLAAAALLAALLIGPQAQAQGVITSSSAGFGSYSGQADPALNTLYCGLDVNTNLGLNHTDVISTAGYQLALSLDANFGGIGTGITLTNPSDHTSANIVQTASGAGSAWQTSYLVYDIAGDRLIVFNQAAGNDVSYQWGYSNTIVNLTETGWNPLWSDHYHPTYSETGFASQVGNSPCMDTSFHFDDGRGSIVATPIETQFGSVTHITNAYQLKSNMNQSWGFVAVDQSLYLNGVIAVQSKLQVTLVGKSGWVEGPISPAGTFSIAHGTGGCTSSGCSYEMGSDVAYVLLNYTIGNQSYEVAILEQKSRAIILQTFTPYCTSSSDPANCGAVQIHSFLTSDQPTTIAAGQIRNFQLEYYVGSPAQLGAIGLNPVEGRGVTNYSPGLARTCTTNLSAASNNQYSDDPADNLVDGSGFYSSNPFLNNVNDNGTFTAVAASSRGAGHLQLSARTYSGTNYGFPSLYELLTVSTDAATAVSLGIFNTQPDNTGTVDIPLGYKLNTNYLAVVPILLGQDSYSNFYLQITRLQMCN